MGKKLFILAVIALLFSLISSKELGGISPVDKLDIEQEKNFTLLSSVLYLSTYVKEEGYIAHRINFYKEFELKEENVKVSCIENEAKYDENTIQDLDMKLTKESKSVYIVTFKIQKNYYAITKISGLGSFLGKTITIKAYYFSKPMAAFLIILIIVGILLVLALIFWIVRKIFC